MAMDWNALLNDPMFAAGASIMGNSGQPGVVGSAFGNMQKINQLKQQAQMQQRAQEAESAYRSGTLANANRETDIKSHQVDAEAQYRQAEAQKMERQMRMQEGLMRLLGPKMGLDPGAINGLFGQQQQGPMAPQQPQQPMAPQQPQGMPQQGMPPQGMPPPQQAPAMQPGQRYDPRALQQFLGPDQLSPQDSQEMQRFNNGGPQPSWFPPQGGQGVPDARSLMQNMAMKNAPQAPNQGVHQLGDPNYGGASLERPFGIDQVPPTNIAPFDVNKPGPVGPPKAEGAIPAGRGAFGQPDFADPQKPMMKKTGMHGVPDSILNGMQQVESGGNPEAINKQSGAMGPYQFMPGTVDLVRQQHNPQFDPFNPQQAREAAAWLMQTYLGKNGNDLQGALAKYGGFVNKDPSGYTAKVARASMQGVPDASQIMQNVSGQQGAAPAPAGNPGLDVAQAGALLGLAGVPGAGQFVQLGTMMQPKAVQAGSYQRDANGDMQYISNPDRERELEQQARRIAQQGQHQANENAQQPLDLQNKDLTNQKLQQEVGQAGAQAQERQLKVTKEKAADLTNYTNVTDKVKDLNALVDRALQDPGLKYQTGYYKELRERVPLLAPAMGADAAATLHQLSNRTMVEMLSQLKSLSTNGSTGMGQLSEKEGDTLRGYIAELKDVQSEKQMRDQLNSIKSWANRYQQRAGATFKSIYGETPATDNTPAATIRPKANYEQRGFKLIQ